MLACGWSPPGNALPVIYNTMQDAKIGHTGENYFCGNLSVFVVMGQGLISREKSWY